MCSSLVLGFLALVVAGASPAGLGSAGSSMGGSMGPGFGAAGAPATPNILVVLADDLGVDQLAAYGEGSDLPHTPVLDDLAAGGLLFRNAWGQSICSPARASLLTGRYPSRHGVGGLVIQAGPGLPLAEVTLPEMLDLGTGAQYAHAAFGKWHLGNDSVGGNLSPNAAGFSHYAGNPNPGTYTAWTSIVDGVESPGTGYLTTAQVDAALAWIGAQSEPWLAYVAFDAPHVPYHAPPAALHTQDLSAAGPPTSDPRPYFKAMVEAMDTELGRLLAGLGPALAGTVVIFAGDNGTQDLVVVPPFDPNKAKTTPYEGGVNVPLIVSGPGVAVGESAALCDLTDLYTTIADLAGADLGLALPPGHALDSVSLVPYFSDPARASVRSQVYADVFSPNGPATPLLAFRAVRDERYKLIRATLFEELYDLLSDPFETQNLLAAPLSQEAADAYAELGAELEALLGFQGASTVAYGCGFNPPGSLSSSDPEPGLGETVTFSLTNPLGTQSAGALTLLIAASSPTPLLPCGFPLPGLGMAGPGAPGELLVSLVGPGFGAVFVPGPVWPGPGGAADLAILVPSVVTLLDAPLWFQGVVIDPVGPVTNALTNALMVQVGP